VTALPVGPRPDLGSFIERLPLVGDSHHKSQSIVGEHDNDESTTATFTDDHSSSSEFAPSQDNSSEIQEDSSTSNSNNKALINNALQTVDITLDPPNINPLIEGPLLEGPAIGL
jgi:hypothetical protein